MLLPWLERFGGRVWTRWLTTHRRHSYQNSRISSLAAMDKAVSPYKPYSVCNKTPKIRKLVLEGRILIYFFLSRGIIDIKATKYLVPLWSIFFIGADGPPLRGAEKACFSRVFDSSSPFLRFHESPHCGPETRQSAPPEIEQ